MNSALFQMGAVGAIAFAMVAVPLPATSEPIAVPEILNPAEFSSAAELAPSPSLAVPEAIAAPSILSPVVGAVLDSPATEVTLQFPDGIPVVLSVNGERVDPALVGRTETNPATQLTTQTWYGIGLQEGENTITADLNGATASVTVLVRGAPTRLTVEPIEASIPADRRSIATLQGELLDANGARSNRSAMVTLEASDGVWVGADAFPDQPGFQVQAQAGQYSATLRSSLRSGSVRIRATTGQLEAFNQIEFSTALRPALVSGVVDLRLGSGGTDFFGSFREFVPADGDRTAELDFDSAVFATAQVGEWQFTGAYNSDRSLNRACNGTNSLFRESACEQTYPTYGDGSISDIVAPSTDQVYLRLERTSPTAHAGTDVLLWGDYGTADQFAMRSQQFTAVDRQLHGFYGNFYLGRWQFSGFYGSNIEGFQRDAIAPDGTSGRYFLSRRRLIPGSDRVFIETEELNRPGTVLTRELLNRGADYQIDYARGTLLFSQPILRTDLDPRGQALSRRIVATYQYESDESTDIYAGRAQYSLSHQLNRESWIGGTYLQEHRGDRQFELYGADALISFGEDGQMMAEYARSRNSTAPAAISGSAYRLEASATLLDNLRGRLYFRSTDAGFANSATTSFVPGQTRYGAELQARVSPTTTFHASYDHEDNFGSAPRLLDALPDLLSPGAEPTLGSRVDNSLTTFTLGLEQQIGLTTLGLDWIRRDRTDRLVDEPLHEITGQLRSRLNLPLTDNLTFHAQNELSLSGADTLYPDRTILGLDWQVHPSVIVSLNQQFLEQEQAGDNAITSLDISGDYHPWSEATVAGRFSVLGGYGVAGAIGLQQGISIAPGLRLSLAYEHIFASQFTATGAGARFPQPYAVGQGASALGLQNGYSYSIGVEYSRESDFQANARFEHRTSSAGANTVIAASALGRIAPELTALLNFQQTSAANQRLSDLGTSSTLRLGLAYRDLQEDAFNALLRYEYRRNPDTVPNDLLGDRSTGAEQHLFAAEAIYAPDWRWEFYGKFALRHGVSGLASDRISSTVALSQFRATHRFAYRWDIAAEARWIQQPVAGYSELGLAIEMGYYLNPNLRLSAGYSLGSVSDRDFSGDRTTDGLYLGITLKLDNALFEDFGIQVPEQSSAPLRLAPLEAELSERSD